MHAGVAKDGAHRVQQQHQIVRPGHIDALAPTFLDQLGELQIDLGMDGLGRQEHDGAAGCLAGDDITLGDVTDMFLHVTFHRPPRRRARRLVSGRRQRAVRFQRKFRIDADRSRRRGHFDETVHPPPVAKRVLEGICRIGKRVAHQVFQLHFAKGATRLLVR